MIIPTDSAKTSLHFLFIQLWGTDVAQAITDSDDQAKDEHL